VDLCVADPPNKTGHPRRAEYHGYFTRRMGLRMIGTLAMYGAVICWGFWGFALHQAVKNVQPLAIQWLNSVPYMVMMPFWYWLSREHTANERLPLANMLWALGGCSVSMFATFLFSTAMKYERASVVIGISSAYPLVTMALLQVTGTEKIRWQQLIGGLFIVAGLVILQLTARVGGPEN